MALVLPCLVARPAAAEDAKAEASAQQAIEKAGADYDNKAYGKALYRLGKALRGCGKTGCADTTVAALDRDAGSVHVRQHDKKGATKLFARAICRLPALLRSMKKPAEASAARMQMRAMTTMTFMAADYPRVPR